MGFPCFSVLTGNLRGNFTFFDALVNAVEKAARCSRCKGNDITSTQIIYVGSSELAISSSHVPKDKRILKS